MKDNLKRLRAFNSINIIDCNELATPTADSIPQKTKKLLLACFLSLVSDYLLL